MQALLKNMWSWLVILLLFLSAGGAWWYLNRAPQLDQLIRTAFDNAELVVSYAQEVETETIIDNRRIRVVGEYRLDDENKRYSSLATTTITLPEGASHSFTLHTITIGDQMYTQVVSHSTALNLSVPSSPEWKQFKINAIPTEYREIATPRPPLDNITLFKNGGAYFTIKDGRRDETVNGETIARYTFNLSSKAFTETTGPVSMIAERVGVHGTVDVWVHESTAQIRQVRFTNEPYVSTTVFSHVNALPEITSPTQ